MLLDEPFSGLDQPARESLVAAMLVELRRLASTTIFVTHDRREAHDDADRVLVLAEGRVRQHGAPAAMRAQPVDATVTAYIGADPRFVPATEEARPVESGG